ncbi:MAG: class I SAM-dependent methyltransferase [Spirochaetales bacterium]|nr:class I SAM-dependent methyltransferase [Spirochaetales bacterium]
MEIIEFENKKKYTEKHKRKYTKFADFYDKLIYKAPAYRRWLEKTLAYITGKRILEVAFGTGYLMSRYANRYEVFGLDNNEAMRDITANRLKALGLSAELAIGDVEQIPYQNGFFDCVLCTFGFSNFPDGPAALKEMLRVIKPGGRLIMLDMNYPKKFHVVANFLILFYKSECIIRDISGIFDSFKLTYSDMEIGGFGTVHLYIVDK